MNASLALDQLTYQSKNRIIGKWLAYGTEKAMTHVDLDTKIRLYRLLRKMELIPRKTEALYDQVAYSSAIADWLNPDPVTATERWEWPHQVRELSDGSWIPADDPGLSLFNIDPDIERPEDLLRPPNRVLVCAGGSDLLSLMRNSRIPADPQIARIARAHTSGEPYYAECSGVHEFWRWFFGKADYIAAAHRRLPSLLIATRTLPSFPNRGGSISITHDVEPRLTEIAAKWSIPLRFIDRP
jgi:hypothetical protein